MRKRSMQAGRAAGARRRTRRERWRRLISPPLMRHPLSV
jgi:hypothetical protein